MKRRPARTAVAGTLLALAVPLVPGVAYVTASDPAPGAAGCAGARSGIIAARSYLADPAGLEAGKFWWRASDNGGRICSGMVQMWLRYPRRENAEWLAGLYRGSSLVTVIAGSSYVTGAGWHSRQFTIPAGARAAGSICLTARLGHDHPGPLVRSCADFG